MMNAFTLMSFWEISYFKYLPQYSVQLAVKNTTNLLYSMYNV